MRALIIAAILLLDASYSFAAGPVTAVFDVEVQGLSLRPAATAALSDFLASSLAATGEYQIVPRDELSKMLREQKAASYRQCYDESCQIEIGKELAADHALATKIVKLGSKCLVTMKLFELRRSTTAWAATARGGCSEDELLASIEAALASRAKTAVIQPEKPAAPIQPEKPAVNPSNAACARYTRHGRANATPASEVLAKMLASLRDSYFAPERLDYSAMLRASMAELGKCVPQIAVQDLGASITLSSGDQRRTLSSPPGLNVWKLQEQLKIALSWADGVLPPNVDRAMLEYAALAGALSALDQYTQLITPRELAELKVSTAGKFAGVGMVLAIKEGRLTVVNTVEGSPAARAGVKSGDLVRAIDNRSTEAMLLDEAVRLMRGEIGSEVKVRLERDGRQLEHTIRRAEIKVPALREALLLEGIGYIKLTQQNANADQDFAAALAKLGPLRGLILDLRDNPGGLLEQSVKIADRFLVNGLIVGTSGPKTTESKAKEDGDPKLPIVVLVNKGTSSGAEILAGALKLNDRAVLIGEKTFGKGTVQVLYDLPDGAALKVTIAEYVMAKNYKFADRGIPPDIRLRESVVAGANPNEDPAVVLAARLLRAALVNTRVAMLREMKRVAASESLIAGFE